MILLKSLFLGTLLIAFSSLATAQDTTTPTISSDVKNEVTQLLNSGALDAELEKRLMVVFRAMAKKRSDEQASLKNKTQVDQAKAVIKNIPFNYATDHITGLDNAKFSIIEYADYGCPFCSEFHNTMKTFTEQKPEINWVYRHYPIRGASSPSSNLAFASECVSEIGGNDLFWKYNHAVYADPAAMADSNSFINNFALANNLNVDDINTCKKSVTTVQKVMNSGKTAQKGQLSGTPGVIVRNNSTGKLVVLPGAVKIAAINNALNSIQ